MTSRPAIPAFTDISERRQTMDGSLYLEKNISQQPAIDLLCAMGYTYISPEDCEAQRGSRYHVLLKDILRGQPPD